MKITKLINNIFLVEDILDLQQYPNLFEVVKTEAGFNKKGYGRQMSRMTNKGLKYTLFGKPLARRNYTETVLTIRKEIERKLNIPHEEYFNTCTFNYYGNGASGFRDHTDRMPDLEQPMLVATLTLGNSNRVMRLTNIRTRDQYEIKLKHNSLIFMGPGIQDQYLHGIPKEKKMIEPRLSLSFRRQRI